MKITLVIASMGMGGAERVASVLTNAWIMRGHHVSIVTFDPPGTAPAFALAPSIAVTSLGVSGGSGSFVSALRNNFHRLRWLRNCLRTQAPDVVVAFMTETNVLAILAGFGASWPTIVSERIHPAHHRLRWPWSTLRQLFYRRADAVVAQTSDIADWLVNNTAANARVIANPVDIASFRVRQRVASDALRKRLVAVGRLDHQKGYDILIDAFAAVASELPQWDLAIFGEGPERAALSQRIAAHCLDERIALRGVTAAVASVYREADALVHAARYEGYPNVIIEALASGLPVIATDSPGATREILADGHYGVLVSPEDVTALASAMAALLNDPDRVDAFSRQASAAVAVRDVPAVSQKWLDLFVEVIAGRRARQTI